MAETFQSNTCHSNRCAPRHWATLTTSSKRALPTPRPRHISVTTSNPLPSAVSGVMQSHSNDLAFTQCDRHLKTSCDEILRKLAKGECNFIFSTLKFCQLNNERVNRSKIFLKCRPHEDLGCGLVRRQHKAKLPHLEPDSPLHYSQN